VIILSLLFQTVFLALGQIWANKFRALLTTLGVIIGVASIIAVAGALTGLERFVLSQFEKIGTKRVFIHADLPESMRGKMHWRDVQLKQEELQAILRHCPSIDKITPMMFGGYPVIHGTTTLDGASVVGIWPDWHEIVGRYVIQGRPFSSLDEQERHLVCLVNDEAIRELHLENDPVGDSILIGGRKFLIVGVVETIELSAMFGGGNQSTEIFIPLATAKMMNPSRWIDMAWAQLASPDKSDDAQAEIKFVLRTMRALKPDEEDTFMVRVLQQFIDQFNQVARGITALASGVVGISLLVGGIGIMNIMLVSVSERTREIGLRKAVGARPAVILMQFLVESVVLSLVGAGIGLAIGNGLTLGLRMIPNSPLKEAGAPAWAVLLSVGFSAAIGVIFGMFPAIKAARLDPIVALRHD